MSASIEKLISIASEAIDAEPPQLTSDVVSAAGELVDELRAILISRNGFYAFEGALHFFPARSSGSELGIAEWNGDAQWKSEYDGLAKGWLCFAEDAFGGQFAISNGTVVSFDPETGDVAQIAMSLDGWARAILDDYNVLTGYPVAAEWQRQNGKLAIGKRLVPRTPFVCGGEFKAGNLVAVDALKGMRARGNLARQIRDLPDGAQIRFKIE